MKLTGKHFKKNLKFQLIYMVAVFLLIIIEAMGGFDFGRGRISLFILIGMVVSLIAMICLKKYNQKDN